MNYVEEGIYAILANFQGLRDLVEDRVYFEMVEEDSAYPSVVYDLVDENSVESLTGPSGLAYPLYQVTALAETPEEAKAVAEQVRLAMLAGTGSGRRWPLIIALEDSPAESPARTVKIGAIYFKGRQSLPYHEPTKTYQVASGFEVWWNEPRPA